MATMIGHASGGRLDRRDPAEGRGDPQRAADVVAEAKRRGAGGDHRRFPSAGAAARPFEVPRIVGPPVKRIVGLGVDHELRNVGLGDRDSAGREQRCDVGIVVVWISFRRDGRPNVDAVPTRSKHSLIVTGRPASGPELLTARQRLVDLGGLVSRAVIQLHGHRVELGIDRFEPGHEVFDSFGWRKDRGRRCAARSRRRTCPATLAWTALQRCVGCRRAS